MHPIYNKMKIFHFPEKLDSLPRESTEILPPLHVRIKPTNVCNHRCAYCAYRARDLQLGQNMETRDQIPRDKMLEIISDLIDMGVNAVTFSGGGEPLMYPYLEECIRILASGGVAVGCLSNGARLSGSLAETLSKSATWLRISIDGWDESSYASYRHVSENEFGKVMENLASFIRLNGTCHTGVSMIVDQTNADHIYELAAKMARIGVHTFKISPCIVSNHHEENNAYHAKIFNTAKAEIEKCQSFLAGPDFEVYDAFHYQLESFDKPYDWCPFLQILPVIGADLNVYTCQDKAYNLETGLLGSIQSQRFRTFWFSSKENFFETIPRKHCSHHCVANAKNRLILEYLCADRQHLDFV